MNAKELRIGNYINFNNQIGGKVNGTDINGNFKITLSFFKSLYFNSGDCEDCELNGYYSPIPLTEEILQKCGFGYDTITYYIGNFMLLKDKIGYIVAINSISNQICKIEYLHELQNLFKDLQKKELEINL